MFGFWLGERHRPRSGTEYKTVCTAGLWAWHHPVISWVLHSLTDGGAANCPSLHLRPPGGDRLRGSLFVLLRGCGHVRQKRTRLTTKTTTVSWYSAGEWYWWLLAEECGGAKLGSEAVLGSRRVSWEMDLSSLPLAV